MDSAEHESLGPLSDEARRAEKSLQQLRPRSLTVDRDRLMFLAGIEAEGERREARDRQKMWIWPAAAAGMTAVAASLLIALALQLARPPVERVIVREVVVPGPGLAAQAFAAGTQTDTQQNSTAPSATQYVAAPLVAFPSNSALQMRNMALRFGVEALPAMGDSRPLPTSTAEPLNHFQQLRQAVELPESSL